MQILRVVGNIKCGACGQTDRLFLVEDGEHTLYLCGECFNSLREEGSHL